MAPPLPRVVAWLRVIRLAASGSWGRLCSRSWRPRSCCRGRGSGSLIEKALPENNGKLHIGGVTWQLRALVDIVTDAPVADRGGRAADRRPRGDGRAGRPAPGREGQAAHADRRQLLDPRAARAGGAVAVRRAEEQRGHRLPGGARAQEDAAPAPAGSAAKGAGIVLRDRGRRDGRPERDLRLPRVVGPGAATRARARVAEADGRRSQAPDVRLRRRAGASRRAAAGCASSTTTCCRSIASSSTASPPRPNGRTTSSWTSPEAETGRSKLAGKGFFTGIYGETSRSRHQAARRVRRRRATR